MKRSGIITLITDFGLIDPYVAMMKGVILSISPAARLIDITHGVNVGSISGAAGVLRETCIYFPEGTVHLAVVDPGVGSDRRLMAFETGGHLFVGPDNGIFWPLIEHYGKGTMVSLAESRYFLPSGSSTFHGRDMLAPVAAHLSRGIELSSMGPEIVDPVPLDVPRPYEKKEVLYGEIARIDNFGNLITNIREKELRGFLGMSELLLEAGKLAIRGLSRTYSDAEEGTPLALINSSGMLEVAVNLGRAAEYTGLDRRDLVGRIIKVKRL